ncbi:tape measure protein [Eubacteriales bacterium OttesenSCG-928-A19]|nr:tape measure protein [Eubacteriales bacterium OttesenSCG-928-A19]
MAYDGTLRFGTAMDSSGFQKDTGKLNDIAKGLTVFKVLEAGFRAVANSVEAAVTRYDTLNRFPQVMEKMGYSAEQSQDSIQRLSNGIQGLPTTLDGIVASTRQLAIATGDLDKGTDSALALNNAFLASGSVASEAERGMTQYIQMLSSGKVDMQSWRTLNETMTYALQKTAESFGFAGSSAKNDLYAALRDGDITFTQFNDRIIELNDGVGGFAEMAKTSSGGIGTAWTNLQTAIVRETATIIGAIDNGLSKTRFVSIENIINTMKDGVVLALGLVAEAFGFVAENIDPILIGLAALAVAVTTVKFLSLATQTGSLTTAFIKMLPSIVSLVAAKASDAAATLYLNALYAKDAIAKGLSTAATLINTAAAKSATAAANGNIIALAAVSAAYVLDTVKRGLNTVATWASTAASTANTAALRLGVAAANGSVIAIIAQKAATVVATAAQWLWNAAINANPIGLLIVALAAVTAGIVAFISWLNRSGEEYKNEKKHIEDLTEAHEEYTDQLAKDASAAEAARSSKMAEIETNRATVQSLNDLIAVNQESGDLNHTIAATVDQLNSSMEGLGLAYDSTTGKLNMSNDELIAYIDNLESVTNHQLMQDEYNRLLQEQNELQQKINTHEAKREQYAQMLADGVISQKEYNKLIEQSDTYLGQLNETMGALTVETEAAGRAAAAAYDSEAEAAVRAQQIRNNQMAYVEDYAAAWGMTAEEVIDAASRMAGGLEELAAQQAKLFTESGQSVDMIAEIYNQSTSDIQAWLDETGKTLDDYVKHAEQNLSKDGLNVEQLAEKWGVSAESIQRDMLKNGQTAQEWEEAQQDALDSVREYAVQAGKSYEDIASAAAAAGMSVNDYVAYQKGSLTSSGMDIQQVADYWGTTVEEIQGHMDAYGVSLDQAHQDMTDMRTKGGRTLDELATLVGKTADQVEADAAAMGQSWQDYGSDQEAEIEKTTQQMEKYADQFGLTVAEVVNGIAAMGGDTEAWVAEQERLLRAAQVAEDDYVQSIKDGGVEISEAYAQQLEARRINGEELSAADQAYLDKYKSNIQEQEDAIQKYAETYGVSVEQIVAEYQTMEGGLEEWATKAEQEHQRALVAEQDYVEQIKAGNVEIDASYAQSLEARRVNGEELNAVEQAYLEQWKAMNQAAVEAYKAQQQEIVDASKAKASAIKLSEQDSAKDILAQQAANNEATAQYVQNYNTIWGQIPATQREYLAELGVDNARFLQDMVSKWDEGGKEQWETYVAGIEEGKTTASQLAGEAAEQTGDAFIAGTEAKEGEIKQAGTDMADATGEGMKDSTAPSEASQAIADAVIEDLTNADYSAITGGIAAAITAGTSEVTAAAKSMADGVLSEVETMKTDGKTKTAEMMTNINSEVVSKAPTIKASVTSMGNNVVTEITSMQTRSVSITTQMLTSMNSLVVTYSATIKASVTSMANGVVTEITSMQTRSVSITTQMMTGMNSVVVTYSATIKASITSMANGVVTEVTSMQTRSVSITTQMMTGMNSVIITYSATIKATATSLASGVVTNLETMVSGGKTAATNMMSGMLQAMRDGEQALYDKAKSIADKISSTLKSAWDEHSPSKVSYGIMEYYMIAMFNAMDDMEGLLIGKALEIADGITDTLTISPEVAASLSGRLQAIVETNPISPAMFDRLSSPSENPSAGNIYNFYLTQHITSPKPLSESELTREAKEGYEQLLWQLP